jgi:hypothetical protein
MDNKIDLGKLRASFPAEAIKTREIGGGKRVSYVEGHTVIRRLNDCCTEWSFVVLREWMDGTILKAQCELSIPGLGSRQHIGVQRIAANGGEDLHKGHVSDALKKCATLFGIGLELYGPDYEGEDSETREARAAATVRETRYRPEETAGTAPERTAARTEERTPVTASAPPPDIDERKKRYWEFAAAAHEAGRDVTEMRDGETKARYSYRKIGRLIVELTKVNVPTEYRNWFPALTVLQKASRNLATATERVPVSSGSEER